MSFLDYLFSTNTAAPPSSGYVELNNATQTAATLIWVHHITNANNDATIFLDAVVTGDEVYIQEKANSAQLLKFNVTANAIDRGTYTELAVSLISSGGQAIGNKDSIFFGIVVRGQPGPPGPTAVSTDAGNVAKLGTDSLIFVPPYTAGSGVSITNQVITNTAPNVQSDWNASSGLAVILNKPALATVATSGSYTDLTNKPVIPAAQVNSDWNASSGVAQILNQPPITSSAGTVTITGNVVSTGSLNATPLILSSTALTGGQIQFGSPLASVYASIAASLTGNGSLHLATGAYYNVGTSQWIPTLTAASTIGFTAAGGFNFTVNTGLTVNTAFSPTVILNLNSAGTATFTGSGRSLVITPGDTTHGNNPAIASSTGTVVISSVTNVFATSFSFVGTSGLYVWSANQSGNLQISCANGGNPTLTSSTGTTDVNGGNFRILAQGALVFYNADNTQYLSIRGGGAGVNNFTITNSSASGYLMYTAGGWMGSNTGGGLVAYSTDMTRYTQISTAVGGNPLYFSSTAVLNCSVAWTVSSDYRLKKNVEAIADALPLIMKLRPVTFNWLSNGRDLISKEPIPPDGRRHMGFIAHEVQGVLPDVVVGEKDAVTEDGEIMPQGVTDTELIALLVRAVQELAERVETLWPTTKQGTGTSSWTSGTSSSSGGGGRLFSP
jgi:hypothetical protein